jgi:hypothetical protein
MDRWPIEGTGRRMDGRTHEWADGGRQGGRERGRQAGRQTDRQTCRHTNWLTD